ncbi:beta-glucoside-specific PTS transporter subunit IIABC [Fundicoccus culcitae]|uniref:Beta-glucoside-specific PTS transporter subunit IIABC n=1 Tax=Fundicoccus culcitae TaxID=2969821 RepID=A0ABY5P534_9LACT|nr:beta-glucoside-specific PTS transporter subunit IIABC [Fundicoccus culcitae]UUX33866.1 beta-glucoside-specific PTS transporter subunit IIABC [Fundicoccus culcitae]
MAEKYNQLADQIVELVGGKENVVSLYHCITRLRFKLKDESIAAKNENEIKKLNGVLSVAQANNQYQVIIGNEVDKVYAAIDQKYKFPNPVSAGESAGQSEEAEEKGNIVIRFLNTLTAIFNPIIMPLAGAGMIKALLVLLTTFDLMSTESATYGILSAAGNSVFYFLPLFLAVSAARVFKANPFISLAIVAALMEPNFTNLITETGVRVSFLGIPTVLMSYTGTVIPSIIAIFIYSYLERWLKTWIPKSLEIFLLPMISLLIMVPLTVIVLGPIGVTLGNGLGDVINFISARSGLLAGFIIGGFWSLLVMVGVHWGVVPIMINNIATYGYDVIRPMIAAATFASAGAALGVYFRAKKPETKSLALSSMVPALLGGITEPIVYGISIKYKKPLYAQIIGGGIAGAFMGMMQTKAIVYVFPALTTLPAFAGDTFVYYIIGISIAFFLTAILTYIFGIDEDEAEVVDVTPTETLIDENPTTLIAPMAGELISIEAVDDPVFSSKAMGNGFAVKPTDGKVVAPITGKVSAVFPTKHAFGIVSDTGIEVLVHIGINTVELDGKGFDIRIQPDDYVDKGQVVGQVDLSVLKENNYDTTTMVVITNSNDNPDYTLPPTP